MSKTVAAPVEDVRFAFACTNEDCGGRLSIPLASGVLTNGGPLANCEVCGAAWWPDWNKSEGVRSFLTGLAQMEGNEAVDLYVELGV